MDKENKIECINLSQYIKVDEVLPVFNGEEAGIIIRREDDTFIYLNVGSNMYKEIPKILIVKGKSSGIFPRKGENKLSWSEIPTLYLLLLKLVYTMIKWIKVINLLIIVENINIIHVLICIFRYYKISESR